MKMADSLELDSSKSESSIKVDLSQRMQTLNSKQKLLISRVVYDKNLKQILELRNEGDITGSASQATSNKKSQLNSSSKVMSSFAED